MITGGGVAWREFVFLLACFFFGAKSILCWLPVILRLRGGLVPVAGMIWYGVLVGVECVVWCFPLALVGGGWGNRSGVGVIVAVLAPCGFVVCVLVGLVSC